MCCVCDEVRPLPLVVTRPRRECTCVPACGPSGLRGALGQSWGAVGSPCIGVGGGAEGQQVLDV